jgi:plasmid maintenance system antidote protein VapI
MTDSIGDLLPKNKYEEPPEVRIIKDFVMEKFQQPIGVTVQSAQIIIHVKSAALAGALRVHLHELQELCQMDQKLVIRIG